LNKMEDLRQSKEYFKFMESMGWIVENKMFIKKLPLIPFSFIKYQRPKWPIDFEKIEEVTKKYRAVQIKIELNEKVDIKNAGKIEKDFLRQGYRKDKSTMLPTKTIWLNLNKSEKDLLKEMHLKTRYNIRKHKQKVKVIRGDKVNNGVLKEFYEIYQKNAKKQKFWGLRFKDLVNLFKCFREKSYLLWVENLGGLILLVNKKTIYYSHNAASKKGRSKFVPTMFVWRAIQLGKKLGCNKLDFEGIADSRFGVTKKWKGFTRFKRGFGGNEVKYIGSFSKFNKETLWQLK